MDGSFHESNLYINYVFFEFYKKEKLLLTIYNHKFCKKYLYKTLIGANTFRIIKLDEILCRLERRIKYSNIK